MFTVRLASTYATGWKSALARALGSTSVHAKPAVRTYADVSLNLRENNTVRSSFPDVAGFENVLMHELIWRDLEKWSDKVALVCAVTGKSYSYKELRKLAGRCATAFRKNKLEPGETIGIVLPNIPEFAVAVLGANEAALPVSLVNPIYSAEEIKGQLKNSDTVAVITILSKYEDIKKSIKDNPKIRLPIIVINDGSGPMPSGCINFDDLLRDDIEEISQWEKRRADPYDTLLLPYSSGTTGLPKGVELCHRSVVVNILQITSKHVSRLEKAVGSYQEVVPLILPLFHMYGLTLGLYQGLRIGAKMICLPKFSMNAFANVMKNYDPTILYLVPPMLQMMVHGNEIKPEHIKSLKHIVSGAAPLGGELVSLFKDHFKTDVSLTQGYGLSESGPVVTSSKDAPAEAAGYIVPNTELRVVGQDEGNKGENLGIGEVGEIYVRGPQIMKGYYKNPEATANTMDGDWLKTGDIGSFDENGLLRVQDRLKDLIKVSGFQVAPAELEELIRGFEKVQDVAVIGVADPKTGEAPKAFIVPKSGVPLREEEVKEFVARRVAKYKELAHVTFTDSIPKSMSGKILRKELRKLVA